MDHLQKTKNEYKSLKKQNELGKAYFPHNIAYGKFKV